eukprot:NODE_167_length_16327_cov_0.361597.p8 type:complete len:118 gc:universal NODE_167_length_16327_cov_0.361597:4675-5028(+)
MLTCSKSFLMPCIINVNALLAYSTFCLHFVSICSFMNKLIQCCIRSTSFPFTTTYMECSISCNSSCAKMGFPPLILLARFSTNSLMSSNECLNTLLILNGTLIICLLSFLVNTFVMS